MKNFLTIFLFLGAIFISENGWAAALSDFEAANAKYSHGDYQEAVSLYEKMIASGKGTAAVYYNLGNAAFRAEDKGKALVAYERAHGLSPRDRDVEWNKAILKSALSDRIEDSDDNVFISSVQRLLEWVTVDETALVLSLMLAVLFLISALNFFSHKSKSLTSGIGGFFVLILVLSAAVFYFKWLTVKDRHVVVLDKEVTARYGPSDKETKAFVLHEGAEAKILDRTDGWYYVVLQNKSTGWLSKKSCEII